MDISIIGTGNVGSTLGKRWAESGHKITYGSREPQSERVQKLVKESGNGASAANNHDAMQASPLILLAVPWKAAEDIIKEGGDLKGKVIIDCINTFPDELSQSLAEKIAEWAVGAHVIKAFNMTGSDNMADPVYGGQKLSMFICGDEEDAKGQAASLAEDLGFEVIDAGGLDSALYLESLARLWIHLAYNRKFGKRIGWKLLER